MLLRMGLRIVLLLALFAAQGYGWSYKKGDPSVKVVSDTPSFIQLEMDEGNKEGITLIIITEVDANEFTERNLQVIRGDASKIKFKVTGENGEYNVILENSLDYDDVNTQMFTVRVSPTNIGPNPILGFTINVKNINDNKPEIKTPVCSMKENTTITVENSTCEFDIHDNDGNLQYMKFTIEDSSDKESTIFSMDFRKKPEPSVKDAKVYIYLQPGQLLDFEKITLYIFEVFILDKWGKDDPGQNTTAQVIIHVIDIPDMPPLFLGIFSTKTFPEESKQQFQITAKDGDVTINAVINYRLETKYNFAKIGTSTGVLDVEPIDRDTLGGTFDFKVVAYERDDPSSNAEQNITFIVTDIDDNCPIFQVKNITVESTELLSVGENTLCPKQNLVKPILLSFEENFLGPINLEIDADDIDEGNNAKYKVSIQDPKNIGVTKAIQVVPGSGYKNWTFSLQIINSSRLDYEDKDWRQFIFNVLAVGEVDPRKTDSFQVNVSLIDVNDNPPIFQKTPYNVQVKETVSVGYHIIQVLATDEDEGDVVRYRLTGVPKLDVTEFDGLVFTTDDYAFDYEKITELTVQIQASDNNNTHQTLESIHIEVIDVNDETPVLMLASGVTVEENSKQGLVIATISATDADKGCDLQFSIDWENSYAMKNYGNVTDDIYQKDVKGCIGINTKRKFVHEYSAELYIHEIVKDNTPDYEKYDSLYLTVIVRDLNQEVNRDNDTGLLFISIKNINDNAPEFTNITKLTKYKVTEKSDVKTPIGSVTARDIDGDKLEYSIKAVEKPETEKWVAIDIDTGALTINDNNIDADHPKRWSFTITVSVTDQKFITDLDITIQIIDTNNNAPEIISYNRNISIYENTTSNTFLDVNIKATDDDRDEPYHTLTYTFEEKSDYFMIDAQNGSVFVRFLDQHFDRDKDKNFTLSVIIRDNPDNIGGRQNQCKDKIEIVVNLLDSNTHKPTIKENSKHIRTWESLRKGKSIEQRIEAEDKDEGDNAKISFKILSITPLNTKKVPDIEISTDPKYESQIATLTVKQDLKDYYGNYTLTIWANDFGQPPLNSTTDIQLTIEKYNFEQPKITFPEDGHIYYLRKLQFLNLPQLFYYDNRQFESFEVDVTHCPGKWKYDFSLTQLNSGKQPFKLFGNPDGQYEDALEMVALDEEIRKTIFKLQLDVTVRNESEQRPGDGQASYKAKPVTFQIQFYDLAPPHFKKQTQVYSWEENDPDLKIEIDKAKFDVDITYNATISYVMYEDNDMFKVDEKTGTITLKDRDHPLDYENRTVYSFKIRATTDVKTTTNDPASIAYITIKVIDVNDNPPVFVEHSYYASIKETTERYAVIMTVNATDRDVVDQGKLTYKIGGKIESHTKGTQDIENPPFEMDETRGEIKIRFKVFNTMSGYFTFNVKVTDSPPQLHTDLAEVHIYIIAQINLVEFNFGNKLEDIHKKEKEISQIFEKYVGYQAYFDNLYYNDTSSTTVASVYFMDDNKNLITNSDIMKKVMDWITFKALRKELLEDSVNLMPFDTPSTVENIENILKAWLIGVSIVLGTICIILIVAFILKIRSLSQRIQNLTVHRYGSQESGLNRLGLNAPTTNRHAIEGSNPVYTIDEKPKEDIDHLSLGSGDSDLIGIEDKPEFNYETKE